MGALMQLESRLFPKIFFRFGDVISSNGFGFGSENAVRIQCFFYRLNGCVLFIVSRLGSYLGAIIIDILPAYFSEIYIYLCHLSHKPIKLITVTINIPSPNHGIDDVDSLLGDVGCALAVFFDCDDCTTGSETVFGVGGF